MPDDDKATFARISARLLQHYDFTPRRAAQLFDEIAPLNEAVLELASSLKFEDEPAGFSVLLLEGQTPGKARRR